MESDRELLEFAAKAAGLETEKFFGAFHDGSGRWWLQIKKGHEWHLWNPLFEERDALRLAVKLQLRVIPPETEFGMDRASVRIPNARYLVDAFDPDPVVATCRAIVLAAAEIGKQMNADKAKG